MFFVASAFTHNKQKRQRVVACNPIDFAWRSMSFPYTYIHILFRCFFLANPFFAHFLLLKRRKALIFFFPCEFSVAFFLVCSVYQNQRMVSWDGEKKKIEEKTDKTFVSYFSLMAYVFISLSLSLAFEVFSCVRHGRLRCIFSRFFFFFLNRNFDCLSRTHDTNIENPYSCNLRTYLCIPFIYIVQ